MRFDFSEDQIMLAEAVRKALESLPATSVPTPEANDVIKPSFDAVGKALAEVGLFGLLVPEGHGGLGLGMVEAVAASIETGRAAAPFPAIETIVAAAVASRSRTDVAEQIVAGAAAATAPIHGVLEAGTGSHPRVEGTLSVPFADRVQFMVAPVSANGSADRALLTELADVTAQQTDGIDLTYPLSRITVTREVSGNELIDQRVDQMLGILVTAELVGAAEACLERTVQYLKERQQFGKIVGSFQGLKHIAADCEVGLQAMKASVEYAAALHDRATRSGGVNGSDSDAENAYRIAKAYCSETGLAIARQCIQMHGGIAFTWEYRLHVHFRRITRLANAQGTAYEHYDALADAAFAGAANYGGLAAEAR